MSGGRTGGARLTVELLLGAADCGNPDPGILRAKRFRSID
jgi:hypothetical protein